MKKSSASVAVPPQLTTFGCFVKPASASFFAPRVTDVAESDDGAGLPLPVVVNWNWNTASVYDNVFLPLVEAVDGQTIVLADVGFRRAEGVPANLKLCPRNTWNERMLVETTLSLVTMVCQLKKVFHRTKRYFEARLAYVVAMFNAILALNRSLAPETDPSDRLLHFAQYAL